jgi:hypothetical protein
VVIDQKVSDSIRDYDIIKREVILMAWSNETYLIGEKVKVEGEKGFGVVSRIDVPRGLVYVIFKRMREEAYPYPEAFESGKLKAEVTRQK